MVVSRHDAVFQMKGTEEAADDRALPGQLDGYFRRLRGRDGGDKNRAQESWKAHLEPLKCNSTSSKNPMPLKRLQESRCSILKRAVRFQYLRDWRNWNQAPGSAISDAAIR